MTQNLNINDFTKLTFYNKSIIHQIYLSKQTEGGNCDSGAMMGGSKAKIRRIADVPVIKSPDVLESSVSPSF